MPQASDPWLTDDVWSDQYIDDVDALDEASRGLGWSFVVVAVLILGLLGLFALAGGPVGVYRFMVEIADP